MTMNPKSFFIALCGKKSQERFFLHPGGGSGFYHKADVAARCL